MHESASLVESDHTQQAIKTFGTTYYKTRAGFMLKDGRLLDLSDEGGYRDDHRAIAQAMEDENFESNSDYLIAFMNEGNIRLIPELPGVDVVEEPTEAQYKALKDYIQFWIIKERHFEVQFSDRRGNQKDWKEYEGLAPASEVVLDIEQHFHPEEFEESFLRDDYTVPELLGTDHLYHATYKPYWDEIKRTGRIKPGVHSNWEGLSHSDAIYLSRDYDNAVSYAETAENVPEEYLDQIVVLEVDVNKLDASKLHIDRNQVYWNYDEVDIEDLSTWIELQYEGSIPVAWIAKVTDNSESLTEMYPHKGERKTDFINRFMRAESERFPNVKQRYAVAYSYWDKSRKDRSLREAAMETQDPRAASFQKQINQLKGDIKVTLYEAKNGHSYAEEYLRDLYFTNKKLCAKMLANIQTFKQLGSKTPREYSKYLEDGIFELRASVATNEARELYFFAVGNNEVLVTNGCTKKSQKTPKEAINKAKKLRDEYYEG